ncbi:MarR family winged helix-turn-helix transcriptional regulator [Microbacterium sp. E-13]|uniref:MarR family winged helix-turn-helix transcriptional regulator n=1 Tax=Microbacterium sp. E-13 TaxID=3404048 RepID=UPI003CF53969
MPPQPAPTTRPVLPPGTVTEPLGHALDPESFTPRLLALLSNALVWRESHELRRRFGLGTNEWRVISALAIRPGASATEISEFLAVNKAIVSKSVGVLVDRGLLVLSDGPRGSRPLYLTESGAEMHDDMLPISMRGQDLILSHVSGDDVERFNALLHRMLEELRDLQIVERTLARAAEIEAEH